VPGCGGTSVRSGHVIHVLTSDRGLDGGSQPDEPGINRLLHLSPDFGRRPGPAWQFVFARRQAETHNQKCLRALAQQFHPEVICIWNLQGLPRSLAVEAESLPSIGVAYWLAGYSPAEPDEYWLYWSAPTANPVVKPIKQLLSSLALSIMRSEGQPITRKCNTLVWSASSCAIKESPTAPCQLMPRSSTMV